MKNIKLYTLLVCLLLSLSCTKNFEEINKNPNQPDYGTIQAVNMMQALMINTADVFLNRTWSLNGELIQYTVSGTSSNAYHRYVIPNTVTASSWSWFARLASNANEMERLARDDKEPNYEAISITMKCFYLSNLTDCFGDIPYYEAFGNINGENIKQPKFDTQEDVYIGILKELKYANSLYNTDPIDANRDLLYRGDVSKWKKFTNSLRLRLLMRLSNRDAELNVSQELREIYMDPSANPVFTSNEDNATFYFDSVEPFVNTFGSTASSSFTSSRRCCKTIIDLMAIPGDPRISVYFKQNGERWQGRESGMPTDEMDVTGTAILNRDNLGQYSSPYSIMKYDEVLFILCEAAKRGWIDGGDNYARDFYEKAITASILYWYSIDVSKREITERTISNFLAKVPYNNTLEQIMTQKYVALFWCGYEAWHEYRRTGYPVLVIGTGTQNDHILPTRFQYPDNTASVNIFNYQEEVERLHEIYKGEDNMKTPVWWSKQAVEQGIHF